MALRIAPPRVTPQVRALHERIALVSLGALAAHGLLLLGDGCLRWRPRAATGRCGRATRRRRRADPPRRLDIRSGRPPAVRILLLRMNVAPPSTVSALAGMQTASHSLDVAAHNVANANTEAFAPLRANGTTGATESLDLPTQMVSVATAPIVYAANAQVVRAGDQMTGSLLDLFA
jgi:hypothetical protein